ncbi:uncharacterized protein AKAW2_60474A [Aspergillus luchuensis]|uniref:Uncharacterized protein n=1 Tax=Aspergillus kawachii TaxID=1069201 RepID=A0A7R7WGD0_ASPKA|nr:uncharacterized protein AKAW2_60474A [Aspergillus luchuensis]BCS02210.1 hypothetical protein AKAW2_60474A [Aspergillus luchuensis]
MAVSKSGGKKYGPVRKIEYRRRWRQSRNFDSKAHVKQDAQRWRGRSSAKTKKGYLERAKLYEVFLVEEGFQPHGFYNKEGHPVPTLEELT